MLIRRRVLSSVILVLIFLFNCNSQAASGKPKDDNMLEVAVHHQSATCGTITESQWLADQQQYEQSFHALNKGSISDSSTRSPAVDFQRYGVLVISMGQQRTGGYSVKLASSEMQIIDGRGKIHVQWNIKKPGMITIQMLTNPCLLLKVPKGNFSAIDVIDQSGSIRAAVTVK